MKEKIFAVVNILLIIGAVTINTVKLHRDIDLIYEEVSILDIGKEDASTMNTAKSVYEKFKRYETFMGLTVNHEDLSNIEESFAELLGYITVGDTEGATVTKNRLLDELSHLRRLSGLNIDAII